MSSTHLHTLSSFPSLSFSFLASASVIVYVCETLRGIRSTQVLSKHSLISQSAGGPGQVIVRALHMDRLLKDSGDINVCMKQRNSIIFPSRSHGNGTTKQKTADCRWSRSVAFFLHYFEGLYMFLIADGSQFRTVAWSSRFNKFYSRGSLK